MDFSVNEQCFVYNECDRLRPFVAQGKPVFNIEYGTAAKARKICPRARTLGFNTLVKRMTLGPRGISCV
ncbi:MAG: endo alpha-1,4 polygalactosaminidase, partial [Thermomicrobiales bacterium]